ncbi:MAG: GNAT family N-acetyltransferase [Pseudomonadota bacterium]
MIRTAKQNEAAVLTRISFDSKEYWYYPQEYFEIWKNELTITPDYIEKNDVYVYEKDGAVAGYYSIVYLRENIDISGITIKKGFWLEHMFIESSHIGKGIGAKMFHHLRKRCIDEGMSELGILADPNARGFYEKMGCQYVEEYPSTIQNRTTPYLILRL